MCEYCKYNKMNREEFKKKLYNCEISPKDLLDVANIGTYINDNELVAIYFDDGIGIEQDSIKIVCCPICKENFE
jgi:hypothetical protein